VFVQKVGQIACWPHGPDVAIFYLPDGQSITEPGMIVPGNIESGLEALSVNGPVEV
jgi:hypothetical protein